MSQIDMFNSQPGPSGDIEQAGPSVSTGHDPDPIPSSCPPKLVAVCNWIMLFEWNEEEEKPFKVMSPTRFGSDIKPAWLKSVLSPKARQKKLSLDGKFMSLFGKFKSGTDRYNLLH